MRMVNKRAGADKRFGGPLAEVPGRCLGWRRSIRVWWVGLRWSLPRTPFGLVFNLLSSLQSVCSSAQARRSFRNVADARVEVITHQLLWRLPSIHRHRASLVLTPKLHPPTTFHSQHTTPTTLPPRPTLRAAYISWQFPTDLLF